MAEIEDYGKKIGGAKKDLWKMRGLMADDLFEMNDREKAKYVKKDNVWKKPDYNELVKNGLPVRVAYFYKMVRDSLPAKPVFSYDDKTEEQKDRRIANYVDFVGNLRDAVMVCRTESACERIYADFILGNGYATKERYYLTVADHAEGILNNKVLKAVQVSWRRIDQKIKKSQFCYDETDKLLAPYAFYPYSQKNVEFTKDYRDRTVMEYSIPGGKCFFYPTDAFAKEENWKDNTVFFTYNHSIVANNFSDLEKAKECAVSMAREIEKKEPEKKEEKKRKQKFVPKQLSGIQRTGPVYAKRNVTGNDYLEQFAIRGGEFGNWMTEKDRQASLDFGYEAFCDLADILKISYKDVSFDNRLSIAFGARGSGNASAHYEPERKVINLTKLSGAGCLAHEWGHALDDYLGECFGINGMLSDSQLSGKKAEGVIQEFKDLVNAIKYKPADEKEQQAEKNERIGRIRKRIAINVSSYISDESLSEENRVKKTALLDRMFESDVKACMGMTDLIREVTGHVVPADKRRALLSDVNLIKIIRETKASSKTQSDYYKGSVKFDSLYSKAGHGYWQSSVEMFARAFDCYVADKLKEHNRQSDYLTCYANSFVMVDPETNEKVYAIPIKEERETINTCFDKLFDALKERELLQAITTDEVAVLYGKEQIQEEPKQEHTLPVIDYESCEQMSLADLFDIPVAEMPKKKRAV